MKKNGLQNLTAAAMLIAIGIIIPTFSPLKIILEPASYTLASHVAIFIGMLISPMVGVAVSVGTTIGFFLGGFPIVVVMRAATHLIFALVGSLYVKRNPTVLAAPIKLRVFSLLVNMLHALGEILVVIPFYVNGTTGSGYTFARAVLLLVGVGTVIHGMIDFEISIFIYRPLHKSHII